MSRDLNKVHIALNTGNFEKSVAFYRAFFGREPVKLAPGYAKFDLDTPALNFTLNAAEVSGPGALNHLGFQVGSTAEVDAAKERLEASGLITLSERDTDCCYALQDKVWVADPDGYRWEVFVVKVGDTRPAVEEVASAASAASNPSACC